MQLSARHVRPPPGPPPAPSLSALVCAQDELGVSGRAATTPAAAAAAASRGGGSDATAAAIATTASLCTAADSLLSALGPLHDRDTPPTAAVMHMSRDVSTLGRRVRDAVAGCLAHLRQKDVSDRQWAVSVRHLVILHEGSVRALMRWMCAMRGGVVAGQLRDFFSSNGQPW